MPDGRRFNPSQNENESLPLPYPDGRGYCGGEQSEQRWEPTRNAYDWCSSSPPEDNGSVSEEAVWLAEELKMALSADLTAQRCWALSRISRHDRRRLRTLP